VVALTIVMCWGMSLFLWKRRRHSRKSDGLGGVRFDTAASLADNIKNFSGKDVFIHLRSGKTVEGYVKSVGNGLIHLEKLSGRDFMMPLYELKMSALLKQSSVT